MADWATISSLVSAGGTLVLAVATFASVRSANRSARVAEFALQEQRRPVLVNSRSDDPSQTAAFRDGPWITVPGGGAVVEVVDDGIFMAMSVRNVGAGIAVLQAWQPNEYAPAVEAQPPTEEFKPLSRDQYVAGGDLGFWQGALRDADDPAFAWLAAAASERLVFMVDLLYTDQIGGQRTISRFGLQPIEDGGWRSTAARHWYLDAPAPR